MRLSALIVFAILLATVLPLAAAEDTPAQPALAEDVCTAPFNLLVPGDLVREHGHLDLVSHYADAANHLRVACEATSLSVVAVAGGEETAVGSATYPKLAPGAEIVVMLRAGGVAVSIGAETVMRAPVELTDGGGWGVLSPAGIAPDEIIFQPIGDVIFSDDFMRVPGEPGLWEDLRGQWRLAALESARYSANAFTLVGRATGAGTALTAAGHWFWEDCTVEASVRPGEGSGGFGVGLGLHDENGLHLLRFVPRDGTDGALQIVRVRGGEEEILATEPARAHLDEWHRLALSAVGEQLVGTLDGAELLSVTDPTLAPGQALLWVSGEAPVAFDDVTVYSGSRLDRAPTVLSHSAQSADPTAAPFINDQYMHEWADERDQWVSGRASAWHSGYFWGDVELAWQAEPTALGRGATMHICVPADGSALAPPADMIPGYHLQLTPEDQTLKVALRRHDASVGEATVPLPAASTEIVLRRTGALVEALVAGQVVASLTDETPLGGGKVGLVCARARSETSRLQIISWNLMDSTFRAAPTNWHTSGGLWQVTSRWACTPRWAWFQGRADDLASIWTRRAIRGDFVVEFFAGFSMDQPWAPFYQHPGNICVTLCGQNATPGSGYSMIFAGWRNRATGIFRRDALVAQTPAFTMPDILDSLGGAGNREEAHKLHNEWWHIRAERFGGTVRMFVDGKLAATFEDTDPLADGTVGIWTLDNGLTVARARIYYEGSEIPSLQPGLAEDVAPAPSARLTVTQPPHFAATFETGLEGWGPASDGSCTVALAERDDRLGGRCLAVTNPVAGGDFALRAPVTDAPVGDRGLLSFDYSIPEGVALDAYAVIAGERYRLRLTGPETAPPGIEDIGIVTDARADGRWHRATVDMGGLLRPFFGAEASIVLDELQFAAHAVPEYARAGIGANAAGAVWRLDNVLLGAAVGAPVKVRAPRGATVRVVGARYVGGSSQLVSPTRDGIATVVAEDGRSLATDLIAFDTSAPVAEFVAPEADAAWLGHRIVVRISDEGPAGIDDSSLALTVGGQRFAWPAPELTWTPATGELSLDVRAANIELTAGDSVRVALDAVADRAGNASRVVRLDFTADVASDADAPDAPALTGMPAPLLDVDFETNIGPIRPWGADAAIELLRVGGAAAANPAGGQWCLQARCTRLGGLFGLDLGCAPFEASRYPILQFDYRASDELRVGLLVDVAGERRTIRFTDNDATWPTAGRIGAAADDAWHTATVDLHAALSKAFPRRTSLPVTSIAFATSGWPGNRADTYWWLDNVRLHAAVDLATAPELSSRDEAGVTGIGWVVDGATDTIPAQEPIGGDLASALEPHLGTTVWVHATACDGAGNWSEPSHLPVHVIRAEDAAAPVASAPVPADGATACVREVVATIVDEGSGVSPADLRLWVGGESYTLADAALSFDETAGTLTWRAPAGVSLGGDGDSVACRLEARDLTGNAAEPLAWVWRIDHSLDTEAPAAPVASYLPARTMAAEDFESGTGYWGNFVSAQVLRRAVGGATGPGCIELRHLGDRAASGFALAADFGERWREFPVVRFSYRLEGARSVTVHLYGTTFDGSRDLWTDMKTFRAVEDGWSTAVVDIPKALARTNPSLDIHRIFLGIDTPGPDAAVIVDDWAMYSQVADSATLRWAEPADPSGVRGYSWVLDSADDTVPPETISGADRQADFGNLAPGHYCFHVRACDGAGNWGAPAHVPFDLIAPE